MTAHPLRFARLFVPLHLGYWIQLVSVLRIALPLLNITTGKGRINALLDVVRIIESLSGLILYFPSANSSRIHLFLDSLLST